MQKEDDEACEIDSDNDNSNFNGSRGARYGGKQKLEESIRSSRTATFKSVRNGAHGGG